jgi:lipopolysaccharide cholinephosphotransferase
MNKVQKNIFFIAQKIDKICRNHNIKYFLIGGSALGAYRHKGFIPWDDDFDIALLPNDYEKLISILDKELDRDVFFLEKERTNSWPLPYSKVKLNNTLFIENDYINKTHPGIFVDILRFTYTKNNLFDKILDYLMAKIISINGLSKRGYKNINFFKKIPIFLTKSIPKIIIDKFFKILTKREKSNGLVSFLFSNSRYNNCFFLDSLFNKTVNIEFENKLFLASPNIQNYLSIYFGKSYMKIPSLNNQKTHNPLITRTIEID